MNDGQLTWRERGQLWLRLGIRLALAAAAVWLAARLGGLLFSLFAPFLFAFLAAALLNPLVKWLQRKLGWSRRLLSLLLLLLLLGLVGGGLSYLVYAVGRELMALGENWGSLVTGAQQAVEQLDQLLQEVIALLPIQIVQPEQSLLDRLLAWVQTVPLPDLGNLASYAGEKAVSVSAFLLAVVMFSMATYFLTADYPYLRTRAVQHMDDGMLDFLGQVRAIALAAFGGYLKAQLLLSVGVFLILLAGFLLTRQPYGLLLALGLAVLDFIPIVGAGTVMVPWAVIALVTGRYPTAIRIMVIWGVIAMFRRVAEPKFVGNQTGLSPILSLISIYVGMRLGGVLGMILGPILTLVVLNLAGLGMFRGLRLDLEAAADDIASILRVRPRDR